MPRYKTYNEGDLLITELEKGKRYSVRVRFPPDAEHKRWWYSKGRKVHASRVSEVAIAGLQYKQELIQAKATNTDIDVTVGTYARTWHEARAQQEKVQPLTIQRDETEIRRIEKYLGDIKLRELKTDMLDHAYTQMAKDGISQSGRARAHAKLKQILNRAVASGVISRNPCNGIEGMSRPKVTEQKRDEQRVDESDLLRLFQILQDETQDGKTVALWLGAATGMRRGEVLALAWQEVDLKNGLIHIKYQLGKEKVRKPPKTDGSVRTVAICAKEDVDTDATVAYLTRWQKRQRRLFKEHGVSWNMGAPVCSNANCTWQGVDNFSRWRRLWYVKHDFGYFDKEEEYTDAAGVKRIRRKGYHGPNFHSLRHTQATVLIGSGADVKSVQDRLGHAQVSTTLNIYAEAQKSKERATASMMSKLISNKETNSEKLDKTE